MMATKWDRARMHIYGDAKCNKFFTLIDLTLFPSSFLIIRKVGNVGTVLELN